MQNIDKFATKIVIKDDYFKNATTDDIQIIINKISLLALKIKSS